MDNFQKFILLPIYGTPTPRKAKNAKCAKVLDEAKKLKIQTFFLRIYHILKNTLFWYKNTFKEVSGEHWSLLMRTLESSRENIGVFSKEDWSVEKQTF